jgi:hypothetical protein
MDTVPMIVGALLLGGLPPSQAPTLVGRWDLTFRRAGSTFPSWLEVTREADGYQGRYQGRFGHATPITGIKVMGPRFEFLWPNEGNPTAPGTRFVGTLSGPAAIAGELISASERLPFTGVRAPTLERAGRPKFGAPVDLLAQGLAGWRIRDPAGKNGWTFENGVLANTPPSSDLVSTATFTDFRLHLEVNVPAKGNSGIYLRGRHEVQVQDDFGNPPGSRAMGGVYGQVTPTSLPAKRAGEWQTFDITLIGRRVTIVLNGVTIVDDAEIPGITGGALDSDEAAPGPIMLQGDHTGIQYRNIRIEPAAR